MTGERLTWTVDGQVCHEVDTTTLENPDVFRRPFHLKINLAVGGRWPGDPDPSVFPAEMVIEEIRIHGL